MCFSFQGLKCKFFKLQIFFILFSSQTVLDPDPDSPKALSGFRTSLSATLPPPYESQNICYHSSVICHQEEGGNDELDELTPDELKSLLDNFPTLSKQEKKTGL
jgi:hypothetical protein